MPEDMPDRMPKDMSDRMPEDLPVRKCINVMVGITRSKVFFLPMCVFPFLSQTQDFFLHQGALCFELWPSTCSWSELDV